MANDSKTVRAIVTEIQHDTDRDGMARVCATESPSPGVMSGRMFESYVPVELMRHFDVFATVEYDVRGDRVIDGPRLVLPAP
jgi:hypothetical protein